MFWKSTSIFKAALVFSLGVGCILGMYKFYGVCQEITDAKMRLGYGISLKNLPGTTDVEGSWEAIVIDTDSNYTDGAHNIVPHDLDGDGRQELLANSYRSDALMMYTCSDKPRDPQNWKRHVIDDAVGGDIPVRHAAEFLKAVLRDKLLGGFTGGAHYTAVADMNSDGRDDLIVAGDLKYYDVVWYETPDDITQVSEWKKHVVYSNISQRTYHVETGDIDSDGDQDIVFATRENMSVGWLRNDGSPGPWAATFVDRECRRCYNARVADIDNNGRQDIVSSEDTSSAGGKLHLYCYSTDPSMPGNWTDHIIGHFPAGYGVSVFEINDIDGDGDLDVIIGNHQGDVYILENPYPHDTHREWQKHRVNSYDSKRDYSIREIDIGDIDNDGDPDIIVAVQSKDLVAWFENNGTTMYAGWQEHLITDPAVYLKWCHAVELDDIDNDGALDVAVAAAGSNAFLLYFNKQTH